MVSGPGSMSRRAAVATGIPYPPYLRRIVRRAAVMYLLIRCTLLFVLALEGDVEGALHPTVGMRGIMIAVAVFLVWWDRRRAGERLLHANLGARPGWFLTAALLTAWVLDLIVAALLGAT